ncbi:hypothetical protein QM913_11375 [Streptococcus salivarius]|jgi:hypothetical protein|uniref:hypothetical protein n=1 Tax=Streptococcus TaxID=1301 RepID=UPI001CF08A29|nr:hypothetical protein [Streptococcus salivarius]MCE2202528.1 hypothetical protein [Streptococcus thermophilus]HEN2220574.1 hypothetical protein [Streptococcus agalactiae]MCA6655872.1 hypothetical protein [Streptococcus salivarius]MCA6659045.1 hypothetical protein [Streptococcus salivarius]MCE2208758.1 hypothetical protein [Streptococcus thermophilus]
MTSTQLAFQNNKINNTHSFYSPSLEEYIQVNDNEFEDIRNEEIELRALELLSQFLDKYFG